MFSNHTSNRPSKRPGKIIFMLIMGAIVLSVIAFVVQFLWNVILVKAIGVSPISYWHALGLFALSRILFGHYRFGPGSKKWSSHRKKAWRDKWMHMKDAEKAEMREKWKDWCSRKKEG